jgi:hypothetical protein
MKTPPKPTLRTLLKTGVAALAGLGVLAAGGNPTEESHHWRWEHRTRMTINAGTVFNLDASGHHEVRGIAQVPFKGTFDPIVVSATPLDATHVLLDFDVHILATQLGKARGPAYGILDLTTLTYVGEATWAAPSGDTIVITFAGQFVPTDTPGLFDNVETFEIVGGTGRFEGATGQGVAGGQFDFITQSAPSPVPFEGTISSPGSLKR